MQKKILFIASLLGASVSSFAASSCAGYNERIKHLDHIKYPDVSHDDPARISIAYKLKFDLKFIDNKLPNQKVYYKIVNTKTNTVFVNTKLIENNRILEEIPFESFTVIGDQGMSSSKNIKLMIWGIDYAGHQVTVQNTLNINFNDMKYYKLDDSTGSPYYATVYGLSGDIDVSSVHNALTGFTSSTEVNQDFSMAGCAEWGAFHSYSTVQDPLCTKYKYCGELSGYIYPKIDVTVSANLRYSLSKLVDYRNERTTDKINYTFKGDNVIQK